MSIGGVECHPLVKRRDYARVVFYGSRVDCHYFESFVNVRCDRRSVSDLAVSLSGSRVKVESCSKLQDLDNYFKSKNIDLLIADYDHGVESCTDFRLVDMLCSHKKRLSNLALVLAFSRQSLNAGDAQRIGVEMPVLLPAQVKDDALYNILVSIAVASIPELIRQRQ
ncbi:MAG: hypothetical protein Q7K43_02875 [Candidatus Woesearchaeota archaeon]|nr:hypothetical protein [Candidatus Woesearchaeota archaeon]